MCASVSVCVVLVFWLCLSNKTGKYLLLQTQDADVHGSGQLAFAVQASLSFLKHVRVSTLFQHGNLASTKVCGDENGSMFLGFEPLVQACFTTSPFNPKGTRLQSCSGGTSLD